MLDKLLKLYKTAPWFEISDGIICGTDGATFTIVRDGRFNGFPDGNIEYEDMKKLVKAESFGYELGAIWVKNGDEKEFIKVYPSTSYNRKVSAKSDGKATFESDSLAKAIRKIKTADAPSLVFEGYKDRINVRILDFDGNFLFYMNLPDEFDQTLLYDWEVPRLKYKWELVKKTIQIKKENPEFSITKFGGGIYSLWLHWGDCDVYIANFI